MKKYMILAAVALVASAACTKVEDTAPAHKISFEVASYVAQTKANQATNAELGGSFTTNAWFTNGEGGKMKFMNDETVSWDSPVSGQWAPSREYYWPKTGYIDFYSYDGVPAPSTVAEGSLVYTDKTIAASDNILVADAAFHQTQNSSTYHIDGASVKGVPTLFRHMLAKIHFTVKVATTEAKKTPNTKWTVTILNETGKESNIVVNNKGTLTLSNTYTGSTPATQAWTNANNSNHNVGWVASATETLDFLTPAALVMAKNTISSGDPVDLLVLRSIMPQVLGNEAVFTLHYNVKATFVDPNDGSETTYLDENRDFTVKINTIKNASSAAITEWDMNQIITYNVIIDPVGEQILFDPAVEKWDESQTGTINVPQA